MAIQDKLTPEEWWALRQAPFAVGLYVATAIGGKVQEVRERLVLARALHRALDRDHEADLVGAVAAAVLGEAPLSGGPGLRPNDRPALLRMVADAGAAAAALPGGSSYQRWLMELAREVAAAEEDGGFLGLNAQAVHVAEQIALAELVEAVGLIGD